jgi:ribonuclease P protein component
MMKLYGFSKGERLKHERDFSRTLKSGRKIADDLLTIYTLPNSLRHNRLGIIVSKRLVRDATKRNRLKRLFREAFRLNKPNLPVGLDIIVRLKNVPCSKAGEVKLSDIATSLVKLIVH